MNNGLNTEYKERENGRKRREYLNSNAKTEYIISGRNTHTPRKSISNIKWMSTKGKLSGLAKWILSFSSIWPKLICIEIGQMVEIVCWALAHFSSSFDFDMFVGCISLYCGWNFAAVAVTVPVCILLCGVLKRKWKSWWSFKSFCVYFC